MKGAHTLVESVSRQAEKLGFQVYSSEGIVRARLPGTPLVLEVRIAGDKAIIDLDLESSINDFLDDLEESDDLREALDGYLSEVESLADQARVYASRLGLHVEAPFKDKILDILDAAEERIEEG